MRFLQGHDEAGVAHAIDDPLAAALASHRQLQGHVLGFEPVFGDLSVHARVAAAVAAASASLDQVGALAAAAARS
jgi:mannitol-1-phosphate/altronate dehydrogenase